MCFRKSIYNFNSDVNAVRLSWKHWRIVWSHLSSNMSETFNINNLTMYSEEQPGSDNVPDILEDKELEIEYRKTGYFGKSKYAAVYEFRKKKRNVKYVVKAVPKTLSPGKEGATEVRRKVFDEINLHQILHHKNVMLLIRVFEDRHNVYLLSGPCRLGNLAYLLKRRERLHIIEVKYYLRQIGLACKYLHELGIIHRNLKPSNLFLEENNNIMVGNFGSAIPICKADRLESLSSINRDSPEYLSPELVDSPAAVHDQGVDIWAIGCIAYELLTGQKAFKCNSPESTRARIRSGRYHRIPDALYLPGSFIDFLNQTLQVDPSKRLTIDEILSCHFVVDEPVFDQIPVVMITRADEMRENMRSNEQLYKNFVNNMATGLTHEDRTLFDCNTSNNGRMLPLTISETRENRGFWLVRSFLKCFSFLQH